jgi:hypothetical protein
MDKQKKLESGFSSVELLLVIIIVALIAVVGWMVYKNHHKTTTAVAVTTSKISPSKTNTSATKSTNTLSLNSGRVTFTIPTGWAVNPNNPPTSPTQSCSGNAGQSTSFASTCLDSSDIAPTQYVGLNSPFNVSISVYKLTDGSTPTTWFENDYKGSQPLSSEGDVTSTNSINGYNAYYFKQDTNSSLSSAGESYVDVYYVVENNNTVVLLYSRASHSINNSSGQTTTTDYTKYLPTINTFVSTIKITD